MMDKIKEFDVKSFPLENFVTGGAIAVLASELIDELYPENRIKKWIRIKFHSFIYSRFCPKWLRNQFPSYTDIKGLLKLGMATQLSHQSPYEKAGLFLAFDALKDLMPDSLEAMNETVKKAGVLHKKTERA